MVIKKKIDKKLEDVENAEGHQRWRAAALCVGYNELAKLAKTLGERVYFRLHREASEKLLVELGGKTFLAHDESVCEIEVPDSMFFIRFGEKDIELMRAAVQAFDAAHPKPCCDWDTDKDGNCPKHPEKKTT